MALAMGILDTGAHVLVDSDAAPGWKLIATVEIFWSLAFIYWFFHVGRTFQSMVIWKPLSNVKKFRRGQLDEVEASVGCLSKAEVLKAAAGLGLSKQKADALFNRLVSLA